MSQPKTAPDLDFTSDAARWDAVTRRDAAADGYFFFAVKTTGVYCRPSCAARPARRENVVFYNEAQQAEGAGFRPCKRCRPDLPPRVDRETSLITEACRRIESDEGPTSLTELAEAAGLSPYYFHRLFKRITGVTPKAYSTAHRQARVQGHLVSASGVTDALYASGFNSSAPFYEAAPTILGMKPSIYRNGGAGETIWYTTAACSLGSVLIAGADRGLCAILLGDTAADLVADLRARFPKATLTAPTRHFAAWMDEVVRFLDDPKRGLGLPLDVRGTAFQRRVWEALRGIAPGSTATYSEIAAQLGNPRSVRAVAGACAANPLAVAIPCHRVVAAGGNLAGYRWGLERKRRLLTAEQQ
jgi:AraC family transcriptional regulator of adaptative response/methylated-DNA-[protein]-cysteine methyltransferase